MSAGNTPTPYLAQAQPPASPSPAAYPQHYQPHFQPTAAAASTPVAHQTPVPIPQPHAPAHGQVPIRPMHYPQQGFPPNYSPAYAASGTPVHHQPALAPSYGGHHPMSAPQGRLPMTPTPGNAMPQANAYNPPRPVEVYTLPEVVNDGIPDEIRQRYHRDDHGRVLFFTAPPLNRPHMGVSAESQGLGHSAGYLAGRKEWLAERERKRKERDERSGAEAEAQKRVELGRPDDEQKKLSGQASEMLAGWFQKYDQETVQWKERMQLDGWEKPRVEEEGAKENVAGDVEMVS